MSLNSQVSSVLLVTDPSSDQCAILEHKINKHFSDNINLVRSDNSEDASNKINMQKFSFIIAMQDACENGPTAFFNETASSEFNSKCPMAIIKNKGEEDFNPIKPNLTVLDQPINYKKLMGLLADHLGLNSSEQFKAAQTFELIVSITEAFFNKAFNDGEVSVLEPQLKPKGGDISGDSILAFTLNTEGVSSEYVISMEESCINSLIKNFKGTALAVSDKIILSSYVNVVVGQLRRHYAAESIKVIEKQLLTDDPLLEQDLVTRTGVTLPIVTSVGRINIMSF